MGMSATARRLAPMISNLQRIIMRLNCFAACQGIDLLSRRFRTGRESQRAVDIVRTISPTLETDRSLSEDIEAVPAKPNWRWRFCTSSDAEREVIVFASKDGSNTR